MHEFDEFVRAHIGALTRTAYLLTGDPHDAEDLVQTTLARVATHWRKIDDPRAYARRVLYSQSASWWRRRRRRVTETLTADPPERVADNRELEVAMVLRAALAQLTPKQRAVLVLRFYEDCSESETAQRLGVRLGTVKSQTRHALDRLRTLAPELAEVHGAPVEVTG